MLSRYKEINRQPDARERRKFGLLLLGGSPATALGWLLILRLTTGAWQWEVGVWIAGIGAGLGLLFVAVPAVARPFYLVWYFLIATLELVLTTTLLTLFYVLILTPVGLFMRAIGRTPVQKGFLLREQAPTYWQEAEPTPPPSRYYRQF